jgi:hypothetical protein
MRASIVGVVGRSHAVASGNGAGESVLRRASLADCLDATYRSFDATSEKRLRLWDSRAVAYPSARQGMKNKPPSFRRLCRSLRGNYQGCVTNLSERLSGMTPIFRQAIVTVLGFNPTLMPISRAVILSDCA